MAQAIKCDDIQSLLHRARDANDCQKNNRILAYLSARDLSIVWGSDTRYWKWYKTCDDIEVAELIDVCWLEIDGKYNERSLKDGQKYEVKLVVELKDNLFMNGPVKLSLTVPSGKQHEHEVDLMGMPRNKWIGLKVGEFTARRECGCDTDVKFSLNGNDGTIWKRGLVVIGAIISATI